MDIKKMQVLFSPGRMSTYIDLAKLKHKNPETLYLLNAQVSEAFHFPLHIFEIMLRNVIDQAISKAYGADWHLNSVFFSRLDKYRKQNLNDSIQKNTMKHTGRVPKGKVIADLSLSFWVYMMSDHQHRSLWTNNFYTSFVNYKNINPKSKNSTAARRALYNELRKIQWLRNRVAHYEPILKLNMLAEYDKVMKIIKYIDLDAFNWVQTNQKATHCINVLNQYTL